jgi:agmatinase
MADEKRAINPLAGDEPLFGNVARFMGFPDCGDAGCDAEVVITGVPFDLATTGRSGARLGPWAIREASSNLRWEKVRWPWEFELTSKLEVADAGNLQVPPGNAPRFAELLEQHASALLNAGKHLVTFGGDHFITLPLLRAHARSLGPLALIHFDAHTDNYRGGLFDHGTFLATALREELILPEQSVQIGIRTAYDRHNHPFTVLDALQVEESPAATLAQTVREITAAKPCYLSFDIDCLDPAFAPSTGTPVVGGMSIAKALGILRQLAGCRLVGMDLVEVAPASQQVDSTALAAATLALDYLYLLAMDR